MVDVDARFGGGELRLRCLTDRAGILRRSDRQRVEAAMEKFARRFPQIFVAVYTGGLGEIAHMRQFGFWLLNRSAFEDVPLEKPNEAGILLTIDPESKAAGIVFGYLLDAYLDEADTFECLSRAHAYWLEGRYADGILKCLVHLEWILCKRSRQARRDPESFEKKVVPQARGGDAVRRMRAGHRAAASESKSEHEEVGR
ncbi:MAG: hypothetical protein RLZZ245_307 [Verrucomicrobiota bacterium]